MVIEPLPETQGIAPRTPPTRYPVPVRRTPVLALLCLLVANPGVHADDEPYPAGASSRQISGLEVCLDLPASLSKDAPASLVVILHGFGGSASGMAGALRAWPKEGYVVCAPKSRGQGWEARDLIDVLKIAAQLKSDLPIDPDKVHVVGFSNGGWNLHTLAFDPDLKPVSATWVAAGFRSGVVPPWAKERLAALALAGAEDGNLEAARATVPALAERVRSVEVRVQANLGHEWPDQQMPYLLWWMGVMEGRFVPGADLSFEWRASIAEALEILRPERKGGAMLYVHDPVADAENPQARELQTRVFHDLAVRHFGRQLQAVKLVWPACQPELEALKVKLTSTPAIVLLTREGKLKKSIDGRIKAPKLAAALKSLAPDRSDPLGK